MGCPGARLTPTGAGMNLSVRSGVKINPLIFKTNHPPRLTCPAV